MEAAHNFEIRFFALHKWHIKLRPKKSGRFIIGFILAGLKALA
jgi:hypothetical protein